MLWHSRRAVLTFDSDSDNEEGYYAQYDDGHYDDYGGHDDDADDY